jgi:ATP-dependent protease ClpP protease subunit
MARLWAFCLLIVLFIASPHQSARGDVVQITRYGSACQPATEVCLPQIKIQETVSDADFLETKRLIDQTHREAEKKHWDFYPPHVYLNSRGGITSAAMAIGRLLRKEQASVQIEPYGVCYSACVIILAGAATRFVQGKVGIHRPYFEVPKGQISPDTYRQEFRKTLRELRAYFAEMNVNEQLADAMLRIDPSQMRVLNYSELNTYGLTPEDPVAGEIKELKEAQRLGLNRQEYMRRKALAAKQCANETTICYSRILETGNVDPSVSPSAVDFSKFGPPVKNSN